MKKILIALCLANLIACSSPNEQFQYESFKYEPVKSRKWVYLSDTADRESSYYVDTNSIKGNRIRRTAWFVESVNKCTKKNEYCELEFLQEFNCKTKEVGLKRSIHRKNNKVIKRFDFEKPSWSIAVPGTVGATFIDFVCSY